MRCTSPKVVRHKAFRTVPRPCDTTHKFLQSMTCFYGKNLRLLVPNLCAIKTAANARQNWSKRRRDATNIMSSDSLLSADENAFDPLSSRYTFDRVDYHGKSRNGQQDNPSGSDFKGYEQQTIAVEDHSPDTTFCLSEDSSLTSPPPSMPRKRLDIRNHDGTLDLHKLLRSGVRIPLHLPPMLVLPLLTRANIGQVRILLLEKQMNRLEDGEDNPSLAAQDHEKDRDRERETLRKKKEALMDQMLTDAREAIDIAGLLGRPDLQARGFWYLAIAAKEEGNEHLWESYLEKCLEARDSLEGRAAAEELGIHEDDEKRVRRSPIPCGVQSEADKERTRNGGFGVGKAWRWGCELLANVWPFSIS